MASTQRSRAHDVHVSNRARQSSFLIVMRIHSKNQYNEKTCITTKLSEYFEGHCRRTAQVYCEGKYFFEQLQMKGQRKV